MSRSLSRFHEGGGSARATAPRQPFTFEAIEPRLLLSADFAVDMASAGHDLTVRREDVAGESMIRFLDSTDLSLVAECSAVETSALRVTGSNEADTLRIDLSSGLDVPIFFEDATGGDADTLELAGSSCVWSITGIDTGSVAAGGGIDFAGVENLLGGADNADVFAFDAAGTSSGMVDGGAGGFDTIELTGGNFLNTIFTVSGPTSGTIARDDNVFVYTGFEPIVDNDTGAKTVNGTVGDDRIEIRDRGTGDDHIFVVSLDPGEDVIFTNASISELTINADSGADRVLIGAVPDLASTDVHINAGGGDDRVQFVAGVVDFLSSLDIDGGVGSFDEIAVSAIGSVTLTNTALESVTLANIERALVLGGNLDATGFTGQVFHLIDTPTWTEEGPQPFTSALDGAISPFDPSSGATNVVAISPDDRFTIYLGTVNGGIWRNTGSTEVLFELNESTLTDDDKPALNAFAEFLEAHPDLTVEIGGHTDSSGDAGANLTLSQSRADSVRNYLINTRHIDAGRLRTHAYGETRPVAENDALGHSDDNRRVELLVDNWQPLTDEMPGLSISTLAISPLASSVIYAGVGRTSSFEEAGGFQTGLLFSADSGDHWRVLAAEELRGLTITKVAPTPLTTVSGAQIVFVSTLDTIEDGEPEDTGGLFRLEVNATTGALEKIEKVSAGDGTASGLPAGSYTDLVVDPGDGALRPVRLYTANPAHGVFQFTDGGDGKWHAVDTGFELGDFLGEDGVDDLLEDANRIKLAIHQESGVVYAAVLGPVTNGLIDLADPDSGLTDPNDPDSPLNDPAGDGVGLIGLFKSDDFAANWTEMTLPGTTDNGTVFGLNATGQGETHFSMVVDPLDSGIVYVAGDTQGDTTNAAGLTDGGAARIFAFNDTTDIWVQIVGTNAGGTTPHADSRGMVFANDYTLLEVDDGGLARLQNPFNRADQGARRWASLNTVRSGLGTFEVLSVAFDPLNNDILVGTQDNGSAHQDAGVFDGINNDGDGQTDEADESAFWSGTGGDGNTQAVVPFDTADAGTLPDHVLRYSMLNTFEFLRVYEVDSTGALIKFGSDLSHDIELRAHGDAAVRSGLNAQDTKSVADGEFDVFPIVTNTNDPTRMLIAHFGIYESIDTNLNPAANQTRVLPLDVVRQIDPAPGDTVDDDDIVTELIYGGRIGDQTNDDLVIAARGHKVLVREAVGEAFSEHEVPDATDIRAIAVDKSNWKVVYVADVSDIYRIDDITDPDKEWVKITGNLHGVGQDGLRDLEYVEDSSGDLLLVSGLGGVSRLRNPEAAPGDEKWIRLGDGLPNAPVFDVDFIDANADREIDSGDRLLAGTFGRGVWSIDGLDMLDVGVTTVFEVLGASSGDNLKFIRDAANPVLIDVFDLDQSSTEPVIKVRGTIYDQFQIDTRGGADTVTVDHSEGAVSVPRGILYNGGEVGLNTLVLTGGPYTSHTTGTTTPGGRLYHDIVDLTNRLQRVLIDKIGDFNTVLTIDTSTLPNPLDHTFSTVMGSLGSLVDIAAISDGLSTNLPLFGTSLGTALDGGNVETPKPLSNPSGSLAEADTEVEFGSESGEVVNLMRRFIETGTGAFDIDDIADFTTLAQLKAALEGLDESGTGTVTIVPSDLNDPTNPGKPFEVVLSGIRKTLTGRADANLDLLGGKINIDGDVDVSADVTLNLVFGVDNTHGFYVKSNAGHDIVINKIKVGAADDADGSGEFGFLAVDIVKLELTTADATHFDIDIDDTGTAGADGFITIPELTGSPGDYVHVTPVTAPGAGVNDVTLTATVEVSALLPGQAAPFSLAGAKAIITWDDITAANLNDPSNVDVAAALNSPASDALFRFLDLNAQDIVARLTTLRDNLETVYGAEIPYLSDSVTEIVDLVTAFQDKVLDPLTGGPAFEVPSIQALIRDLATSLGITPDQLGLAYNSSNHELTYHLVLSEGIANQSVALTAGIDVGGGLADLEFNTDATVSANVAFDTIVGVDFDSILGDPRDWFFLRDSSATLQATIAASDIEADARFGFLSIGIDEGSLTDFDGVGPASVSLTVDLVDPDTGQQGRVDLREILANVDELDKLIDVSLNGALKLVLPVEFHTPLPGLVLADIADGNPLGLDLPARAVVVTISDLSDTDSFDVQLGSALTNLEFGNFTNIDAPSVVGVLGQLTFWLDQFRHSDAFAELDLPLVGPALDEALQLADSFRDRVLLDDNDTQLDSKKTLLNDLNAALADAGLGRKLFAANDGGKIVLVALESGVSFAVGGATALGFDNPKSSSVPSGKFFAEAKATNAFGSALGQLGGDLSFTVTIDSKVYTVEVAKATTDDNEAIGDDRWKLINADNAATFVTAQQMTLRLLDAFGVGYPGLSYDAASDSLNFTLDLSQLFADLDLPLAFDVANLPEYLQLQTSGDLALKISGGLNLEVGVFLGNAEPSDKLQLTTELASLSEPLLFNDNQRYDAQPVVGKLTGDAHFSVAIDGGAAVAVTVTKIAAAANTTVADLVADINTAIALLPALAGKVIAEQVAPASVGQPAPQQIQFRGLAVLTSLEVSAAADDPAVTDIGIATTGSDVSSVDGENPTLKAAKTIAPLKGRLTADAGFQVNLTKNATATSFVVALTQEQTENNDYPFSIINDIQAELDPAEARVKVGFSNGALTFSTLDGSAIAVSNVTGTATNELGIVAGSGNSNDLLIFLRSGARFRVAFDSGDTTIQHIIDAIETASIVSGTPRVTVAINDAGSGLNLEDHSTGTGTFKVQILNNSTAGLLLGIVRSDSSGTADDPPDGIIEGADIAALTALDRFFVKTTETGDPLASLKVEIGTPVPLTASAKFGFVGLELQGNGGLTAPADFPVVTPASNALQAALSVRLLEPAGSTDGRVSLAEMLDALDDDPDTLENEFSSLFDLSLTGKGRLDLSLTSDTISQLSGLGINVGSGPRIEIAAAMTDGHAPVFTVTTPGFNELDGFGNLDFNFQSIVAGLAALVDFLDDFEALSFLNDPIPVIDVSVGDLVDIAQQFADAVTAAENDPAGTLQALEDKLKLAFGLPLNSTALDLVLVDGPTAGSKVLKIDTALSTGFSKSLSLHLDLPGLDLGGDADLLAQGSLRLDLDFGFDIANPTDIYIFDSTGIVTTLNLDATDLDFKAAVGPLGVFITDGTANIHGTLDPANSNTVLTAGFKDKLGDDDMAKLSEVVDNLVQDVDSVLDIQAGGALNVTLPVYFPTESVFAGEVKVTGSLSYTDGELKASLTPVIPAGIFDFDPGNLSLLDQLLLGVDGVDLFLEGLQDLLDDQIGSFSLPLVGDKLAGAADAIGDFRDDFVEGFRKAIEDLENPGAEFAAAGFGPGGVALGRDPVSTLLFDLLGPTGLGVLDSLSDIEFLTNANQQGVAPDAVFFDWKIHMADTLVNVGGGIGFDLGIPGIGLETDGEINLTVDWALDLGFGINFDDGFYLNIGDTSELELAVRVTTPGLEVKGTLGFLQIRAEENVELDEPDGERETERGETGLTVQFGIDLYNKQVAGDQKLGFAELGRLGIDAKIAGRALADLAMALELSSDLVGEGGNFPSIVADFAFDWGLGTVDNPLTVTNEFAGVSLSSLDGGFLSNGLNYVGFDDIGLDLGKYFSDVIGPIVETIADVTAPIKPFLDFLTEPIPVISDLAGSTSLLDIAAMSGVINPGIIKAIEIIDQVIDIAHQLDGASENKVLYVDATLPGGVLTIFDASAVGGILDFDPSKPFDINKLKGFVDTLPDELGILGDALDAATDVLSDAVSKMRPGGGVDAGFALPIIEDPSQIFGMLLGQPADLVTFTMAPLVLDAEFSAFFSIFGPLGLSINAEFAAQFGPFKFGYDTYGISQFAAGDFSNPELLFDGLYVSDLDVGGSGVDVPELQFDAGLWAAAELNLGIARGGVGGGLFAEIDMNLYDPDDDGKVRIKEIANTISNEIKYGEPLLSPLSIFDISGKLTAELFAFLKIDFGFFEVDEKFQITDPIELLSFENVFERWPTLANELGNGVLQLNIGKNAASRIEGDLTDTGETIYVQQKDATHVEVWAPQFGVSYAERQEYLATTAIIAFGGDGDDRIYFSGASGGAGGGAFAVTSDVKLEIHGDAGNDIVVGTAGNGAALLVGGSGDDTLTGGGGGDTLFGETGIDTLSGKGGNDWLFGDGDDEESIQSATFKVSGVDVDGYVITAAVKASDAGDNLDGGADHDLLFGSGGIDTINGGSGDDVLIGDGGQVTVGADRRVVTTRELDNDPLTTDAGRIELAVSDTSKNGKGAVDHLFGGDNNDHLYGGFGNDDLHGGGNDDVLYGELGSDTAYGDDGHDVVFGDFGHFIAVTVGAVTTLEPETVVGGEKDFIWGGTGNDKLLGGAGHDEIHGEANNDLLWGGVGQDLMWGDGGNDKLYGQSDSDILYGGAGDDYLEGGGSNDIALGGDGVDILVAGYGSDTLDGEADGDTYRISVRGGSTTELTTAYDTGTLGIDSLIVVGTPGDDTLLLRAMADSYFPTLAKLDGLIERYFGSTLADRLAGMVQAFNDAYGPWDVAPGLLQALTDAYQEFLAPKLKLAIQSTYAGAGPALDTLKGFVDEVLASNADSKLDALQKKITEAYATFNLANDPDVEVPNTMFSALTAAYKRTDGNALTAIKASINDYYVAESHYPAQGGLALIVDEVFAGYPAKTDLQAIVDTVYADTDVDAAERLGTIQFRIGAAYDPIFDAQSDEMLAALDAAWDALLATATETEQKDALKTAIADTHDDAADAAADASFDAIKARVAAAFPAEFAVLRDALLAELDDEWSQANPDLKSRIIAQYVADPIDTLVDKNNPDATFYYHNTAFIAVINDGGADVERFNYRRMEGLVVSTMGGADYVVLDDLLAAASINLGDGNDRFQSGQVFRSERVKDFEGQPLITGITAEDVFTTIEITRGWLSNGVSVPTTVNGGEGDDNFTVFRNVAVLNLNGNDGDDVFTVRAFALKGSSDNERARTDMKGDGGADTILYVVNAPVGIDGGDGFDTVRIVGTEFGDDFVVTDSGIFGAGLNVSYVNIERLVADGAEGDDRFFIQSTGLEVVTEIDGGLGSDSYFVGGNPARAPVAVVSNDLRGHSGIILHSVESTDLAWNDLPVEGLSANVADDEEAMILLAESGGRSFVIEGAAIGSLGGTDTYRLRLSRAPALDKVVKIGVVPAGLSPEDEMKNYSDLEVWDPDFQVEDPVTHVKTTVPSWQPTRTITLDGSNWATGVEVLFRAKQDIGYEGRRFTFVNHKIMEGTTDVTFLEAQTRSLKVEMHDDDRDAVIVVPRDLGNTVLEGGFNDIFDVVLSQKPLTPAGGDTTVTVTLSLAGAPGQVRLSDSNETNQESVTLTFTSDNWSTPQSVTVSALDDTKVEGFHTEYIRFNVSSDDVEVTKTLAGKTFEISGDSIAVGADGWMQVDGKIEENGVQDIPPEGRSFVLLPHRPVAETVHVRIDGVGGVVLAASRFTVTGNTITFLSATGAPELLSGKVEVQYSYKEVGYHQTDVRDQVVDIYDNDAPTVIVTPPADGMLDVVEGDANSADTYTVRLSKAPDASVTITIDSKDTRTTWGASAYFENQLLLSDDNESNLQQIHLTFTTANWMTPQTVTVRYAPDTDEEHIDGNDTQVFAPDLQTVNKIRGPLIIEGAAGAGSLTLPDPLMMPWELNIRPSDGEVRGFEDGSGAGAIETMAVDLDDLDKVVERFKEDDLTFTLAKLVGRTLEMTKGAGLDVVLDPARPEDQFDRFWLIKAIDVVEGEPGQRRLTLQNPSAIDPSGLPEGSAPDADSEYAITSLSINFFADEREQVDYLFVYDTDSVADDVGALTSSDGVVRDFKVVGNTTTMEVETSALQRAADLLGLADIQSIEQVEITITVGPGAGRVFKITDVPVTEGETKWLTLVEQTAQPGADTNAPTTRSEFRIAGSDRYGRITGFGMGPNVLFGGRPQGGGITYGDIEVVQVELGTGKDTVRVDYATNAEDHSTTRDGDFYTLTMLNTGGGNDTVTVALDNGDGSDSGDGAFALNTGAGNDTVLGAASTRQLVVFGGEGQDAITTGSGDDIVFGDVGRVDYTKKIDVGGVEYDAIVTRLGSSVPQNPVNPHVTGATDTSISDSAILGTPYEFPTDYEGLVGLSVQVISPEGHVQFRTVIDNTADTITVDAPWDEFPLFDEVDPKDNYYYRISSYPDDQTDGLFRGPRVIWSVKDEIGDDDTIDSGGGDDVVIGGAAADTVHGGAGDDWVAGDIARIDYVPEQGNEAATLVQRIESTNRALGGADRLYGEAGDDIVIGGTGSDKLDGGQNDDLMFGDNVKLDFIAGSLDAIGPRFVGLSATTIYAANGNANIGTRQALPYAPPAWVDWHITLDQTLTAANFGNDTIAGGGDRDSIFGQHGNDTIQGDGSIDITVSAARDATDLLQVSASVEAATDGDDYIEGNAGLDLIFGNLGQDDLIGGSSTLFSLGAPSQRDDQADLIFGGAGTDRTRNDAGDGSDGSHGRDADTITGDNANIYRLVGAGAYLNFNYDNAYGIQIVPRAVQLLDYTPGGPDFVPGSSDIGTGDELHGESGDDAVYGMSGNDVLFGEGQDDVLIAGWGDDWVSGGTGDDAILGDDGRVFISRNSASLGEPLYGVAPIAASEINKVIQAQNNIQFAIINVSGALKYTADLTPDNLDPAATKNVKFRPLLADDILYGGWGNDAIHGGAGDDAVSGAEALATSYTNNYSSTGTKLNAAAIRSDYDHPFNPGNVLGYQTTGTNATRFALFDPANGLRKILLNQSTGALVASGGVEWLLNFANEGPTDAKWIVGTSYQGKPTDGDDHIFGDLGNDWMVGGSGRDSSWAGWGDDLMNGDDLLSTSGATDTNPSYEDLMYGGAGRDVLLINTNGDRAIDWVGEFNSYYTPFSQFGSVSVVRLIQPGLPQYLLDMSKSQGADPTLVAQYGNAARNGEPFGELGMVLQQDAAYQEQSGSPRDAQAGNSKGNVDVKTSAGVQPLYQTAAGALAGESAGSLTEDQLAPLVAEAKRRWRLALDSDDARLAEIDAIRVTIGNLPDDGLGLTTNGLILIDSDAAGRGWFVDATPSVDEEYGADGVAEAGPAAIHMDLLSVIAHELGHAAGLDHEKVGVMADALAIGVRSLPSVASSGGDEELAPLAGVDWAASPIPASAAAAEVSVVPVINWENSYFDGTGKKTPAAAGARWVGDFINHLGKSAAESNPNASLRLHIPTAGRGVPVVSRL